MPTNYAGLLQSMRNEKSMGETIMDAVVKNVISDVFDDSIDPQILFDSNQSLKRNKNIADGESAAFNDIKEISNNIGDGISNINSANSKRLDPNSVDSDGNKNTYYGLKEITDEGKHVYYDEGKKESKVTNYGQLRTDTHRDGEKFIKDSYAPYEDGTINFRDNDGSDATHKSVNVKTLINTAIAGSLGDLGEKDIAWTTTNNFMNSRDNLSNLTAAKGATNYNPNQVKSLEGIIKNLEDNVSIAENHTTKVSTTGATATSAKAQELLELTKMINQYDSVQDEAGFQVSKVMNENPDLYTIENSKKELLNAPKAIQGLFGQDPVSMKDAASHVDRLVASGDYESASYIVNRMIPGFDPKDSHQNLLLANAETLDVSNKEQQITSAKESNQSSKSLNQIITIFNGKGIEQTEDGSWMQTVNKSDTMEGANPAFMAMALEIANTAKSTPSITTTSKGNFAEMYGESHKNMAKSLIKGSILGKNGSDNINDTGLTFSFHGSEEEVIIGTTAYVKNILDGVGENEKNLMVFDLNELSQEQLDEVVDYGLHQGSLDELLQGGANGGLQKLSLAKFGKSQGKEGNAYTAFGVVDDAANNHLEFSEARFYQRSLNVYKQNRESMAKSKYSDELSDNAWQSYDDSINKSETLENVSEKDNKTEDVAGSTGGYINFTELSDASTKEGSAYDKLIRQPFDSEVYSVDVVRELIEKHENSSVKETNQRAVGENTNGTKDYGNYQINSAFLFNYEEGATGADSSFAFNSNGDRDKVYDIIQKGLETAIPGFEDMPNADRAEAFMDLGRDDQWKYAGNAIYQNRGVEQWATRLAVTNDLTKQYPSNKILPKKEIGKITKPPAVKVDFGYPIEEIDNLDSRVDSYNSIMKNIDDISNLEGESGVLGERITKLHDLQNTGPLDKNSDFYKENNLKLDKIEESLEVFRLEEANTARGLYAEAKRLGIKVPWNVGDTYDAGYDIYNDLKNKGKDSKYYLSGNSKLNDLYLKLKNDITRTNDAIEPMRAMAQQARGMNITSGPSGYADGTLLSGTSRVSNGLPSKSFVDRGEFGADSTEGNRLIRKGFKKKKQSLIETLDTVLNESELGKTKRNEFAALNAEKARELGFIGKMSSSETMAATLAVIKDFNTNKQEESLLTLVQE